MKKLLGIVVLGLLLSGCNIPSTTGRTQGNSVQVYVQDDFRLLSSPEASNIASEHCLKHNKDAQYYKFIQEAYQTNYWLFKCIDR